MGLIAYPGNAPLDSGREDAEFACVFLSGASVAVNFATRNLKTMIDGLMKTEK